MAPGADQTLNRPTVVLAGAGSQIGLFAIPRLLDQGFKVIAVGRSGRPDGFPALDGVEWQDEAGASRAVAACGYLLSTGPMDLAHRLLEAAGGLQRAVVFSSTSVEAKAGSGNRFEKEQIKQLRELESVLAASARATDVLILRPTMVYGCGLDANISRLAKWIRRFGFIPVNGPAAGLRQPVHADDLAAVAIKAMLSEQELPPVLNLAGGETLAYTQMVRRIFPAVGKPVRLLHLPGWLFVSMVKIAGLLKPGNGLNTEMVRRQAVDLVFDDSEARELLEYKPRPFKPTSSDFSLPDLSKRS